MPTSTPNQKKNGSTNHSTTSPPPSSYPLSVKFLPVGVLLIALWIPLYFPNLFGDITAPFLADTTCKGSFNYTFQIARAKHHAETLATHDWEIGTVAEAVLELVGEGVSVFGPEPFPRGEVPGEWWRGLRGLEPALEFVMEKVGIPLGETLMEDEFSATDPASLGVSAVMLGQSRRKWREATRRQKDFLFDTAPRYANGAISHRVDVAELWSDAVFMFPPFLAYYGVAEKNVSLVREAVRQIGLYRDVLVVTKGRGKGLWRHIVGPSEMADGGAWSTGNGWVVYGMARVRATISGWDGSRENMREEMKMLEGWMEEVIGAVIQTDDHPSGLLRNYLGEPEWFGEVAGTALIAAAAYRLGMFGDKTVERERILTWANEKRRAVAKHVDEDGVAKPVVNSLKHDQKEPWDGINPEAESFLLLLGAAWRDCYCARVCSTHS